MNRVASSFRVAVIGAGIAGATCARALSRAGCAVHVVDKSRGAGGRLATRRLEWLDPSGRRRIAAFDHGAPAFTASGADFRQFLATASQPGGLAAVDADAGGRQPAARRRRAAVPAHAGHAVAVPRVAARHPRDLVFRRRSPAAGPARLADRGRGLDSPRALRRRGAGAAAGAGRAAAGAAPPRLGAARVARLDAALLDADGRGAPSGQRPALGRRAARAGSVGLGHAQ